MNRIIIRGDELPVDSMKSGQLATYHAMVGEKLSADTIVFEVDTSPVGVKTLDSDAIVDSENHAILVASEFDPGKYSAGDEILYCVDKTTKGKYFFDSIKQTGEETYKITAYSIVGQLLGSNHRGGIYNGTPAGEIYADILQGAVYTIDSEIAAATVAGYLPIAPRRDNLKQLLMATGGTIRIDQDGGIAITSMNPTPTGVFDAGRCYAGGSVETTKAVDAVQVTEHNYFLAGNTVTLFEDGADGEVPLEFNQPYHDYTIEGGEIVESGANYCTIRAKGTVTLKAKPYTHVKRIVTAGTVTNSASANIKTVTNCTLANPQIAQALADRLYRFLQCSRTIQQDLLVGEERAGDVVSVLNPYTMQQELATIREMDVAMSAVNKAKTELLVGFIPEGVLSGFKNHVLLTGNGTWTVPEGVSRIRFILIGGGAGGDGGRRGSDAMNGEDAAEASYGASYAYGSSGAAGGSAGTPGKGGRVFEMGINVTPGAKILYECGTGGIGGAGQTDAAKAVEGTAGTVTTFGNYSSDYGRLYQYGYYEAKTGFTLAAQGPDGFTGGKGGDGYYGVEKDDSYAAHMYTYGQDGEAVESYPGGDGAKAYIYYNSDLKTDILFGGGGGGAAYGCKGANGGHKEEDGGYPDSFPNRKDGGNGADALINGADAVNFGAGGGGGHGGGGGGGCGGEYEWTHRGVGGAMGRATAGTPGIGGDGSKGGDGMPGAIVIYY